jgi:hypothetical protein
VRRKGLLIPTRTRGPNNICCSFAKFAKRRNEFPGYNSTQASVSNSVSHTATVPTGLKTGAHAVEQNTRKQDGHCKLYQFDSDSSEQCIRLSKGKVVPLLNEHSRYQMDRCRNLTGSPVSVFRNTMKLISLIQTSTESNWSKSLLYFQNTTRVQLLKFKKKQRLAKL